MGVPRVEGAILSGRQFHGVVATWIGTLTYDVTIILVAAIAIVMDDGYGGNQARVYL